MLKIKICNVTNDIFEFDSTIAAYYTITHRNIKIHILWISKISRVENEENLEFNLKGEYVLYTILHTTVHVIINRTYTT